MGMCLYMSMDEVMKQKSLFFFYGLFWSSNLQWSSLTFTVAISSSSVNGSLTKVFFAIYVGFSRSICK